MFRLTGFSKVNAFVDSVSCFRLIERSATLSTINMNEAKESQAPTYDFGIGHPSSSLNLPRESIRKCVAKHLDAENAKYWEESTNYGLYEGSWYFRSNLADWMNKLVSMNKKEELRRYAAVSGTNMVLTTGASQAMELLLIHLKRTKKASNPNCKDIVLMEDPSYFLFADIVQTADCRVIPIPFVEDRLDFEYLEDTLKKYGRDIVCFYVIPSHQNPLGMNYSIEDKKKLIQICHQYKLHLIADEVYNFLSFDDAAMAIPFMPSIEQSMYAQPANQENQENDENDAKTDTNDNDKDTEYYCHSVSSFSKIIGLFTFTQSFLVCSHCKTCQTVRSWFPDRMGLLSQRGLIGIADQTRFDSKRWMHDAVHTVFDSVSIGSGG